MLKTTATTAPTAEITTRPLSGPRALLHLESLALTAAAIIFYYVQGWGWGTFFLLLLAPDLSFFAFAVNQKVGARVYNLMHWATLPLALAGLGYLVDSGTLAQIATIWLTHIFLDRILGYGFKYETGFKDTHMQRI
jgi:multisubunit Na+/H+ antiporter MnhB subunit